MLGKSRQSSSPGQREVPPFRINLLSVFTPKMQTACPSETCEIVQRHVSCVLCLDPCDRRPSGPGVPGPLGTRFLHIALSRFVICISCLSTACLPLQTLRNLANSFPVPPCVFSTHVPGSIQTARAVSLRPHVASAHLVSVKLTSRCVTFSNARASVSLISFRLLSA